MAGYTRQSSFVDGDTITAAIFNDEFNQLLNAFNNSTGHKHDGTTAEGPVIALIGDSGSSPVNKVLIDTTNNHIEFWIDVSSTSVQQMYIADGAILPVTDNDIDLGSASLEFKDLYLDGTATIDILTVDESATIGTTLGVTGATTLSSTLAVTGAATLSSTLAVTGTSTLTGNVTASNDVSVGGNLIVTGNTTISGNLTLGDADTDSISIGAEFASDLIPDVDGTYDLGSSSKEWQDLYIDGTANIDSLVADTADINGGTIDGATIATSDITVGASKTLDVSAGTLTLADDQISGDKVEGGTINAITINTLTYGSLSDGTITVTAFVDEDDMTSDSATLIPTQQSVKAYVDAQVTAQDLDFQGDSGGALSIDLDSESLTIAGGTGIDTTGALNTLTVAIDSTVATLTDAQTLTNKTIDVDNNTVSNIEVDNFKASAIVLEAEGISSSDNDTSLPTSAAVKDYVDTQLTAEDLDFQGDSGGALSIDLDSEVLTIAGGTGIDTSGSANTLTVAIDSTVATLTGTQTLTNKTIDAALNTLSNIANSSLTNSSVSYGGVSVSLGGSDATPAFDLSDATAYPGDSSLVTVGALNSGSITSGFGSIDVGSSAITTTGTVTGNTLAGTLSTAAQPNITSVGTLTSLSISGDLTVSGTTTTLNSTTVTVDDPIFTVGGDTAPVSDDNKDRGIEFRWHDGTSAKVGFFGYDDSASVFTFIPDATNTSEVFSGSAGDVAFGNIAGTLTTAAQTNITSVGTLGSLSVTGNITVGGTVDGRDVATDGTKLDGIESGATADQTAAEIRTLVDSATDSNVFTDADHSKLDGIESGATADQTAAEIRTLVESATDSNVFTDADHSKLNGIEAGATADQTITAGTGLTGGGTGDVTLNVSGLTTSEIAAGSILTSAESFVDSDTQVMTAAAIADKIESYGYTTEVGDITGVTAGTGLSGGGTSGTVTLNVDLSELTDMTAAMVGTDEFIVLDAGADRRKAASEIPLSIFNNDAGFTTNVGDITGVTAGTNLTGGGTSGDVTINMATGGIGSGTYGSTADGTKIDTITVDAYGRVTAVATGTTGDINAVTAGNGLTGGGTSGSPTLNVGAGTGIDVAADSISVDVSDFMSNGANNRVLTATGADGINAESGLLFDGNELLISTAQDSKLQLQGSSNPRVDFYESTTRKCAIGWDATNNAMYFDNFEGNSSGSGNFNFYSGDADDPVSIRLSASDGDVYGYVYAEHGNTIGFLDQDGNWAIKHVHDSRTEFYDNNELVFSIGQGASLGDFGSVTTCDAGKGGWAGYAIEGRVVFMHDVDTNSWGIYNDVNNEWMILGDLNGTVGLRYDGVSRLETTSGGAKVIGDLDISGNLNNVTDIYVDDQIIHTGDTNTYLQFSAADQFRIFTGGTQRVQVDNTNFSLNLQHLLVNYATATGGNRIIGEFSGNSTDNLRIDLVNAGTGTNARSAFTVENNLGDQMEFGLGSSGHSAISRKGFCYNGGTGGINLHPGGGGSVDVIGNLTKSSGSFNIKHPKPEMRNTHRLIHSFVESPEADNIYSGTVTLVDGTATVNLDSLARMSDGTWVNLNTDARVFTTNETGWDATKGTVSGNTLTITCQNATSTDTISFLIIARRIDEWVMYDENYDENGRLIVEREAVGNEINEPSAEDRQKFIYDMNWNIVGPKEGYDINGNPINNDGGGE